VCARSPAAEADSTSTATATTSALDPTLVNGHPALVLRLDGAVDGVMAVRVEDARITGLYYVRNPAKLSRIRSETPLTLR